MPDSEKKSHKTQFGNFVEEAGNVYISDTVDRADLVVPAEFSKAGTDQALKFNQNTVIYTEKDALSDAKEKSEASSSGKSPTASYFNQLSLVASFAGANRLDKDFIDFARGEMNGTATGPKAFQDTEKGNGFLQITTQDPRQYLGDFTGVKSENLNLTKGQIKAWVPSVAAHELYHLKDASFKEERALGREIEADFGSLRDYFNKDYKTFVTDLQALNSLNRNVGRDIHATHIWAEEYEQGLMPSETQAQDIVDGPRFINARIMIRLREQNPGMSKEDLKSMIADPAHKYGALKALREQGTFDDIAYGNEFVDKYIAAAERRYTPEYLATSQLDEFRKTFQADKPSREAEAEALFNAIAKTSPSLKIAP